MKQNGDGMSESEETHLTSLSQARTLDEIADFWDTHSLADYWDQTRAGASAFPCLTTG